MSMPEIRIKSFGYKFGIPDDVNFLIDVRFLANPYYDESLRDFSGLDDEIRSFMESHDEVCEFTDRMVSFVEYYAQRMRESTKPVVIAFGCTGGRHRSVYVADKVYRACADMGFNVSISHLDIFGGRK